MRTAKKEKLVQDFRIQTIQEATLRVVSRKGLSAATMQEIAREAGIAKGTIYLYFKSREALVQRTAELAFTHLLESLESTMTTPGSLAVRLRLLVQTKLTFFEENRDFFRLYLALCHPGDVRESTRRRRSNHPQYARYIARLEAFLSDAVEKGEMCRFDPSRLAVMLSEGINGVILKRLTEASPPQVEEDVQWIVKLVLEGLSASEATS